MECRTVDTSRGPVRVRVAKSADPEAVARFAEEMAQKARELAERRCDHIGPHPMPDIAQKFHGRETYSCGRDKGHPPPHAWGDLEWGDDA